MECMEFLPVPVEVSSGHSGLLPKPEYMQIMSIVYSKLPLDANAHVFVKLDWRHVRLSLALTSL